MVWLEIWGLSFISSKKLPGDNSTNNNESTETPSSSARTCSRREAKYFITSKPLLRERRALGQWERAEQVLDALIGMDPGSAAAAIERGLIRRQRKDHVGAGLAFAAAAASSAACAIAFPSTTYSGTIGSPACPEPFR